MSLKLIPLSMMDAAQKSDAVNIFGKIKLSNSIDYVGAWYHKAAKLMTGTNIKAAFVSTNSITQGEQVTPLWKKLFDEYGMQIIFGRRTFKWDSESFHKAAIHCVVIGMSDKNLPVDKKIFDGDKIFNATNITPYLVDAPTIFIESRAKHFQDFVPKIIYGSEPREGGFLLLTEDERKNFLRDYPTMKKYVRRFMSANDFINNLIRYCLWLKEAEPQELRSSKFIMQRLNDCADFRANSKQKSAYAAKETPYLFASERQPTTEYLLIPIVSSENRKYIPIGYMTPEIIVSNACFTIPGAQIYHFGILTSSIHMAWMRAVAGRLKSDYRYSGSVVYNNFAWCEPTAEQKSLIEQTAQNILDVRAKYQGIRELGNKGKSTNSQFPSFPDSLAKHATLADLYDELTMPADLRAAHKKNDRAVAQAYGFENILDDEPAIVASLFKMYERLTKSHVTLKA